MIPTSRKRRTETDFQKKRQDAPAPEFVPPMRATSIEELPEGPEWIYEVKWDGYRALAAKHGDDVRLLSLKNKDLAGDFPTVVSAVRTIKADTALLDGEIVAVNAQGQPSFQALQNRSSVRQNWHIVYYAFDLLSLEGENLKDTPHANYDGEPVWLWQVALAAPIAETDCWRIPYSPQHAIGSFAVVPFSVHCLELPDSATCWHFVHQAATAITLHGLAPVLHSLHENPWGRGGSGAVVGLAVNGIKCHHTTPTSARDRSENEKTTATSPAKFCLVWHLSPRFYFVA